MPRQRLVLANESNSRPFLKWVGGKSQLLPELLARIPKFTGTYFEPFIGGGALFFALQPEHAQISDLNNELINCYQVVQRDVEGLITELARHKYESEYYYTVRNIDRAPEFARWTPTQRAARVIFLNKTCFNGLYRVNSKGYFNVPFGRYTNPKILDAENLRNCNRALSKTTINDLNFIDACTDAKEGDFVYFDPPYVPLSMTSSFTSYSADGFGVDMQQALFELCRRLDQKGVKFMLSNSSAPFVLELYRGFRVEHVLASRAINSKAQGRGKINEVVVCNY